MGAVNDMGRRDQPARPLPPVRSRSGRASRFGALMLGGVLTGALILGASASAQTAPVLSGTFVQLNGQLAAMDEAAWLQELDHMRAIGMDTLIIQYSRYGD